MGKPYFWAFKGAPLGNQTPLRQNAPPPKKENANLGKLVFFNLLLADHQNANLGNLTFIVFC